MIVDLEEFGRKVKNRRKESGMSLHRLSAMTTIPVGQLSDIERGYGVSRMAAKLLSVALSVRDPFEK